MRIFCLGTGRSGTTTFTRALEHATNYTSGHESRAAMLGEQRLDYADWHAEADNRLTWMLGPLGERFGDDPEIRSRLLDRDDLSCAVRQTLVERLGAALAGFKVGDTRFPPRGTPAARSWCWKRART